MYSDRFSYKDNFRIMQDQKAMHFSVMNTECLLNKYLTTYSSANLTGNDFTVTVNLVPMTFIICHSSARTFSVFRIVDICINFLTQECWSEKVDICINFSDRQSLRDSSVIFQLDQDNVQLTCIRLFNFQATDMLS